MSNLANTSILKDPCTASNVNSWTVEHTVLKFGVHIDSKRFFGTVDLRVRRSELQDEDNHSVPLDLDVHMLGISSIHLVEESKELSPLHFTISPFASYGSKLSITGLTAKPGDVRTIRVFLSTNPSCPALSWLNPEQTADKRHPFIFSQGQAVLNRSLFPCQDTPGRRTTWEATMIVPKPLYVVMSGHQEVDNVNCVPITSDASEADVSALYPPSSSPSSAELPKLNPADYRKCCADMPQAIPAYLTALAIGDLRCKSIGHRTRVWSEPSLLERATWEFGHQDITERYIQALEKLYGPYQWDDYSIVLMPPSFPYGGMENPRATFATPALLTGDQSLTDVIAHEIAHSWSGNLAACANWTVFWINEGFTMYLQRRACQIVDGPAVTAIETAAGRELLRATVRDYGHSNPLMRLVAPCEEGVDPDEVYTDMAYEGGFAFVSYLKACVGSQEAFDAWLRDYFTSNSFKTVHVVDVIDSFFGAFPHFKGDWSRERWLREEKEEAALWNAVHQEIPSDIEGGCNEDSLPPMPAVNPATGCVGIVDDKGRTGLAYRKGYEFLRWMYASGWPVFYPSCRAGESLSKPAEALAAAWLSKAKEAAAAASAAVSKPEGADSFTSWPTLQKLAFLDALLLTAEAEIAAICPPRASAEQVAAAPGKLSSALKPWNLLLSALNESYGFASSGNAEVRLRWSQLTANTVSQAFYGSVSDFLKSTGKLKYVTPVFRALCGASPSPAEGASSKLQLADRPGWALAVATYKTIKASLHPVVQSRIEGVFDGYKDVTGEAMVW